METEKKLKYMLDEIVQLNDVIEKGREAINERNKLREEMAKLMEHYIDEMSQMR